MSYLVLARKWRPQTFDQVVGQEHVTRTLKNAIEQDRVAHALLFTGSRGIGKTSCARILAKALNCDHGPTPSPCGTCRSCVEITQGTSVDVFEIDGASNNSVEQIREIREAVKFVSTRGKRKMYIIDEVHMLTTAAFNALLKTLEEPPEHVLFVFATTEPHKIPETIISRTQRYDFKRIPEKRIVQALMGIAQAENLQVDEAALAHIAREAKGGMRDSLSLFDQVIAFSGDQITEERTREVLGVADRATLHALTEAILRGDAQAALELTEGLFDFGIDLQKFAGEFVKHLRDLMVIRTCDHPDRLVDLAADELATLQAQVAPVAPARIHRLFSALLKGVDEIARSAFPKLTLEMTLLRLCQQGPTLPLAEVLDGLARLEARLDDPDAAPPPGEGARVGGGRRAPATPAPPTPPPAAPEAPAPLSPAPAASSPPARPAPAPPQSPAPEPVPGQSGNAWAAAQARVDRGEPAPPPPPAPPEAPAEPIETAPAARLAQASGLRGRPETPTTPRAPSAHAREAQPAGSGPPSPKGVTGLESAGDGKSLGPVRAVDSVPWPPPAEMGLTPAVVRAAEASGAPVSPPAAAAPVAEPAPAQPEPPPAVDSAPRPAPEAAPPPPADATPGPAHVRPAPPPAAANGPLAERMPAGLSLWAQFVHFVDAVRPHDSFLAASLAQDARPRAFGDEGLVLAITGNAMGAAERAHGNLVELLEALVGHPVPLVLDYAEPDDPVFREQESLYDQRQRAHEAHLAARREAARQDPGIQRAVEALGAEIVEVRIPEVDW